MAMKDWEKVGENHWENKNEDEWEIKVVNEEVYILEPNDSSRRLSKWKTKNFKTKSQALSYAKKYMRTH